MKICPLMSNSSNYAPCNAQCALCLDGKCLIAAYILNSLTEKSAENQSDSFTEIIDLPDDR